MAREAQWKIHPVVEESPEDDEEISSEFDEDEDLDTLPFDTPILR